MSHSLERKPKKI